MDKWWNIFRGRTHALREERAILENTNREALSEVQVMNEEIRSIRKNLERLVDTLKDRRQGQND